MKVTKREVILLILVLLVGWCYLSYTYLITPAREEITNMEQKLVNAEMRERDTRAKISAMPALKDDERAARSSINEAKDAFVHEFVEEEIIQFIHTLALETGLHVTTLNANGANVININEMIQGEDSSERVFISAELLKWFEAAEDLDNTAFVYNFSINFINSGYEQIINFFKGFEKLEKLISVNNVMIKVDKIEEVKIDEPEVVFDEYGEPVIIREPVTTAVNEDEYIITTPLSGSFTVNLMALDMKAVEELLFPAIEIGDDYDYGKEDPFERDAELWPQPEAEIIENVRNGGFFGF